MLLQLRLLLLTAAAGARASACATAVATRSYCVSTTSSASTGTSFEYWYYTPTANTAKNITIPEPQTHSRRHVPRESHRLRRDAHGSALAPLRRGFEFKSFGPLGFDLELFRFVSVS